MVVLLDEKVDFEKAEIFKAHQEVYVFSFSLFQLDKRSNTMQANNNREKKLYNVMKSRYVGLGNADTSREEFAANIKRDTYGSLIGHDSTLSHLSHGLNKSKRQIHNELIEKMGKC